MARVRTSLINLVTYAFRAMRFALLTLALTARLSATCYAPAYGARGSGASSRGRGTDWVADRCRSCSDIFGISLNDMHARRLGVLLLPAHESC